MGKSVSRKAAPVEDEAVPKTRRSQLILHPGFAARLNEACDNSTLIPPMNYGRVSYITKLFEDRFDVAMAAETVRKWFSGESKPRDKSLVKLAELLSVDPAWLSLGSAPELGVKDRQARNSEADGAVNFVAAVISMHGGTPSFPEPDDMRAKTRLLDITAIIRGATYALHVVSGAREGDGWKFSVPVGAISEEMSVLGVLNPEGLTFRLVDLDFDGLSEVRAVSKAKSGAVTFTTDADLMTDGHRWKEIAGFHERF